MSTEKVNRTYEELRVEACGLTDAICDLLEGHTSVAIAVTLQFLSRQFEVLMPEAWNETKLFMSEGEGEPGDEN